MENHASSDPPAGGARSHQQKSSRQSPAGSRKAQTITTNIDQ